MNIFKRLLNKSDPLEKKIDKQTVQVINDLYKLFSKVFGKENVAIILHGSANPVDDPNYFKTKESNDIDISIYISKEGLNRAYKKLGINPLKYIYLLQDDDTSIIKAYRIRGYDIWINIEELVRFNPFGYQSIVSGTVVKAGNEALKEINKIRSRSMELDENQLNTAIYNYLVSLLYTNLPKIVDYKENKVKDFARIHDLLKILSLCAGIKYVENNKKINRNWYEAFEYLSKQDNKFKEILDKVLERIRIGVEYTRNENLIYEVSKYAINTIMKYRDLIQKM